MCGAQFGTGGLKVCLATLTEAGACPRAPRHTTKKMPSSWVGLLDQGHDGLYVLPVSAGRPEEAHADPVLPVSYVPAAGRPAFEAMSMNVREWGDLFALKAGSEVSVAHVPLDPTELEPGSARKFARTPLKAHFSETLEQYDPLSPPEVVLETDTDPLGVPPVVIKDLRTIHDAVRGLQGDASQDRVYGQSVGKFVEALNVKTNLLVNLVGDPGTSGFPTAWAGIHEAMDSAEAAKTEVGDLQVALARMEASFEERLTASMIASEARITAKLDAAALRASGAAIDSMFPPAMLDELARIATSGGTSDPRVDRLVAEVARLLAASGPAGTGLRDLEVMVEDRLDVRFEPFLAELARVQGEVTRVSARGDAEMILVGDVAVSCLAEVVDLVTANGLAGFPFLFQSPITLLEIAWHHYMNPPLDPLGQAEKERKLGLTPTETAVQQSFQNFLPSAFGDGKVAHKLSRCGNLAAWKSKDFTSTSLSLELRVAVRQAVQSLRVDIKLAGLNARITHMLIRSVEESEAWVILLIDFITKFSSDYDESTSMGSEAVWALVQFLVRACFDEFNLCKRGADTIRFGSACRTPELTARVLWAGFKMHGVVHSYPEIDWEGHATLSPAISKFLLVGVAMKADLVKLAAQMSELSSAVKGVEKKVTEAVGRANRAQGAADNAATNKKKPAT